MTQQDAKAVFESFKSAKADPALTNQQIVTRYNKLYEAERQLRKAGELQKQAAAAQKQVEELAAENLRLKAQLEAKSKASGKAA